MAGELTTTTTVKASEARQHFSELVNRVHETGERVVIEKHGAIVGGIVSRDDLRRLRAFDAMKADANAALDRLQSAFMGIPKDELERQIEKAITETREEMREERRARSKQTVLAK